MLPPWNTTTNRGCSGRTRAALKSCPLQAKWRSEPARHQQCASVVLKRLFELVSEFLALSEVEQQVSVQRQWLS